MTAPATADPRTRHYGLFYGLHDLPADAPVALVHGNCQAESLRVVLDGDGLATVRIPPVHELVAADLPHLQRWLGRARAFVTQPVRDDFHDLPLGAGQLATLVPRDATVVRIPAIRFAGLYPTHAIVRPPSDPSLVPPVVEYHDLRLLAAVARGEHDDARSAAPVGPGAVREVASWSIGELRAREQAHGTIVVSDLFAEPTFAQMRTINHPGNPVWRTVGERVLGALGLDRGPTDPGRPLLDHVHAPRAAGVVAALHLEDEPREHWLVDGEGVDPGDVRDAHRRWYAEHPDAVQAGLRRHTRTLGLLGLT